MSEQQGTPPDGGTPPATPAPATPAAPAPFVVSKDEWIDSRREIRSVKEMLAKLTGGTPAPAATPAAPAPAAAASPPTDVSGVMAEVAELKFRLGLKDALASAGIHDPKFAGLIERAARTEKPGDLSAFVAEYAPLAPKAGAAISAPSLPAPAPIAPSNTGAPAASPAAGTQLPDDPRHWPADVVRKLSVEEFRKALDEYKARTGQGDPLRAVRSKRR